MHLSFFFFFFNSVSLFLVICLYSKGKCIWDIAANLWLFSPEEDYEKSYLKADLSFTFFFFCRDHMQWSQEEEEHAKEKAAENSLVKVHLEDQGNKSIIS